MKSKPFILGPVCTLLWALSGFENDAIGQVYRVAEMNTEQIRALDRQKTAVLLPGGILEEHGPYLPSFTDGYLNERLTQELADAIVASPGWSALIFPLTPLGTAGANEIGGKYSFPGTYAVRSTTLRAVFMDLATELGEQGFRWIFLIHAHLAPSHNRALDQASDYFRDTYGGHMVHLCGLMPSVEALALPAQSLSEKERLENSIVPHADAAETSWTLFLRPDVVTPSYKGAAPYPAQNPEELSNATRGDTWPGYLGSPRLASAAIGARIFNQFSSRVVDLALKILEGLDERQVPRYGDIVSKRPGSNEIDKGGLAYEQKVASRQRDWLHGKGLE